MNQPQPRTGALLERHFFAIELATASALAIGSGLAEQTDRDILTDGLNRPYVPGSTLAGALYALVPQHAALFARDGNGAGKDPDTARNSPLRVEHLLLERPTRSQRVSVALSEQKHAENRFDTELVEGGATGWLRLSLDIRKEPEQNLAATCSADSLRHAWFDLLVALLDALEQRRFRIGAKARRGFGLLVPAGKASKDEIRFSRLALRFHPGAASLVDDAQGRTPSNPETGDFASLASSRVIWQDFCWETLQRGKYDAVHGHDGPDLVLAPHVAAMRDTSHSSSAAFPLLGVTMRVNGPLLVRTYAATAKGTDMGMQQGRDEKGTDQPLVPGTSLAGLFRQDFLRQAREAVASGPFHGTRITGDQLTDALFGTASGEGALASGLHFSEGLVSGAKPVTVMRVGIDPFTGGSKAGALFTETVSYGGLIRFEIRLDPNRMRALAPTQAPDAMTVPTPVHTISGLPPEVGVPADWVRSCLLRTLMRLHLGMLAVGGEGGIGRGWLQVEVDASSDEPCGIWVDGRRLIPEAISDNHPKETHNSALSASSPVSVRWTWKEMPA